MAKILVVDDESDVLHGLQALLQEAGHVVETADSVEDARSILWRRAKGEEFEIVVTDMRFANDADAGAHVLAEAIALSPLTQVIVLTGFAEVQDAVGSMQKGAFSYLTKGDASPRQLLEQIDAAIQYRNRIVLLNDDIFAPLDDVLKQLANAQSLLRSITAQVKTFSDSRRRILQFVADSTSSRKGSSK